MGLSRGTVRGILVVIILVTIPAYICGIVLWLFSSDPTAPRATSTPVATPTWTPIDPFDNLTRRPTDATNTPPVVVTNTQPGFQPIVPTAQPAVTITPLPATNTPLPTNTRSPTPTTPPADTPIPTATERILVPPSDTPSP